MGMLNIKPTTNESAINESELTEVAVLESLLLQEGAKFSILPTFKKYEDKYPELGKYKKLMDEADQILTKEGEKPTQTLLVEISRVILRIIGIFDSIASVIVLPCCIFIFPILELLLFRLKKYAVELVDFAIAKATIRKSISKLSNIKKSSKDDKVKKKCDDQIRKLEENLKELEKKEKKSKSKKVNNESYYEDIIGTILECGDSEEKEDENIDESFDSLIESILSEADDDTEDNSDDSKDSDDDTVNESFDSLIESILSEADDDTEDNSDNSKDSDDDTVNESFEDLLSKLID